MNIVNKFILLSRHFYTSRYSRWSFQELRSTMTISVKRTVMKYLKSVDLITQQQRLISIAFDKVKLLKRSLQIYNDDCHSD